MRIKISTWKELKDRKTNPNESFDDVIVNTLRENEGLKEKIANMDREND